MSENETDSLPNWREHCNANNGTDSEVMRCAITNIFIFSVFVGCCLSLYQATRAVSDCAFLAMALKAWLNSTQ